MAESEPGSLTLDERLERIETDLEKLSEKIDRLLLWVTAMVAAGIGGGAGLQALLG